jgi:cell wall assembly regulator SMI1
MKKSLIRIKEWLKNNSEQTLEHLNGHASNSDISKVEAETGLSLPEAFKEFLRIHNGEDGETWLALLGDGNQLLSCQSIINQYKLDQEIGQNIYDPQMENIEFWKDRIKSNVLFVKGAVKPLMLHPKWLPITCMNGDVFRYLDFDPAPSGISGQVIEVNPEGCRYQVLASSFEDLLDKYLSQLLSGAFEIVDDGYIMTKEENEMHWGIPEWLMNA